jgi:isoquinoline 1-oxidoreductase subunit alpha
MPSYVLTVNGAKRTVSADADSPLLWVLRDQLDLTGTKFGCGVGACAACSVHIDGDLHRSCQWTIADAAGHEVTTVEGLPSSELGRRIQQAWIDEQVPQCGYCQPGQLMAAAALLAATPHPTDADIDNGMSDNICRCATYLRIRKAIHRAAGNGEGEAK